VTDSSTREGNEAQPLLRPGHNCWRVEPARRMAFLIDGAAYFRAVREAVRAARHSLFILGWDIDSRMRLIPEGAHDGYPEPLGDFLNAVVARRRGLRACVLSWDFAMLYALEREWLPVYKLDWRTHRRLTFRLDARHPLGASHHQKVIVVDDAVAFVAGFDLTQRRWDTSAHAVSEPLRRDPDGKPYGPFHDVGAVVDGDAARALGELCRDRWRRAGCKHAPPLAERVDHDPWPASCAPDVTDVDVAIARTEPAYDGSRGVAEMRQLHLDALGAARRYAFMENQYFSSTAMGDVLTTRLREADGPDVVLVGARTESGWLEETTMGVLRARLHRRLAAADAHRRFRSYCPELPSLRGARCLNVHSKVLVVDDEFLTVGSANLSNRSMGFDTECNLAIEARGDPRLQAAIGGLRNRLLAEHLGVTTERVAQTLQEHGSLIAAIESLRRQAEERTLEPLEPRISDDVDALVPDAAVIDPERPLVSDELVREFAPEHEEKPMRGRLVTLGAMICVIAILAAAWRWTPLRDWLDLNALIAFADRIDDLPGTPLLVLVAYLVAGLLVVPLTVLIAATGIVFGPVFGVIYALAGGLLSGFVSYMIGRKLGRETVRKLAGERLNAISRKLAERGLLAVVLVRVVPVAPYTIVNIVAGASHINLRDFLLGTFIGLLPGVLGIVVFVDRIVATVRNPGFVTFALLAVIAGLLGGSAVMLQRRLARREHAASAGD
jgi:phosphatidylserine/phosphatidylglycerophosphate/cardiolipin synthase-like enzyme/membrane protein DedA with SNARE-associated domain